MNGKGLAPLQRVGRFSKDDPVALTRELTRVQDAAQQKSQADNIAPIYSLTTKQTGTYNAHAWEVARMDPTVAACFVVLPDHMKSLGAWIGVKYAAGSVSHTVTVSSVSGTIDTESTYVLNVPRQLVWFYATTDGWERGSTL